MFPIQKLIISILFALVLSGCENTNHKKRMNVYVGTGVASWYGTHFHGNITASGEKYNMNDFTAAHRLLKFGTVLRVTNIKNNLSVVVKINDRGPYNYRRVIDLSRAAAQEINMIKQGLAKVNIEIIGYKPVNFENLFKHYQNLLIINTQK